ncbi:probable tRNA (uracil-O(2)-)-methyltransferase [Strongylocentrotus purpuratus]|uniref:tRNA (uracil-O(2)-)-methyltransferase n=1 Tax=Strongylocentrotus purpuratus TaxID=7668 RepID=A0A7M7T233_STRPU|nr:probable tRNA (uracil-O(2)-)-methyltransferase [Strongylocentrotus purpuratus]
MEELSWTNVHSQDIQIEAESFWRAIDIWWLKPQVINRRISASVEQHKISGLSESTAAGSLAELSRVTPAVRLHEQWLFSLLNDLKHLTSQEENTTSISFEKCIDHHVSLLEESKNETMSNNQVSKCESGSVGEEKVTEQVAEIVTDNHTGEMENEESLLLDKSKMCVICIRKLLPRRASDAVVHEVGIFDHERNEATFTLLECGSKEAKFPSYKFSFQCSRISLHVDDNYKSAPYSSSIPSIEWLGNTLAPKLTKWASEIVGSGQVVVVKPLVPMDRYTELYREMKQKYGTEFVKIWPENTDPQKFVYEDVAIATYLILLFEEERKETGDDKKQSYVDLGCGNGLLVHILNSEGYPGKGIDLRRRKIWSLYGPETHLEESTIIASMETSFKDTDWLIGNHSDELTPWIPVMAARSSYKTRYFVLPCCFHDFDSKFGQRVGGETQYRTYLNFVREAGEMCGFEVEEDKMRIPSTKKICHVGRRKTYAAEEHPQVLARMEEYVACRCRKSACHKRKSHLIDSVRDSESSRICPVSSLETGIGADSAESTACDCKDTECTHKRELTSSDSSSTEGQCLGGEGDTDKNLAPNFKPRAVEERVKNCSRVERSLKDRITLEVAWAILEDGGVRRTSKDGDEVQGGGGVQDDTGRSSKMPKLWRRGGSIGLGDAAKLFDGPTLKNLKSECGGLKTLLKNYNPVFEIIKSKVSLKDWSQLPSSDATDPVSSSGSSSRTASRQSEKKDRERQQLYKTKLCWFHEHHPDSCPRMAEACPFAHGQVELRSRPTFGKAPVI